MSTLHSTSLGCSLLLGLLLIPPLVGLGFGSPWLKRLVLPALGLFLLFQLFGLVYRKPPRKEKDPGISN